MRKQHEWTTWVSNMGKQHVYVIVTFAQASLWCPNPGVVFRSLVTVITPFLCQGQGFSFWMWVTAAVLKLSSGTLALALATLILLPACLVRECCSSCCWAPDYCWAPDSSCVFVRSCRPFANQKACLFFFRTPGPSSEAAGLLRGCCGSRMGAGLQDSKRASSSGSPPASKMSELLTMSWKGLAYNRK